MVKKGLIKKMIKKGLIKKIKLLDNLHIFDKKEL